MRERERERERELCSMVCVCMIIIMLHTCTILEQTQHLITVKTRTGIKLDEADDNKCFCCRNCYRNARAVGVGFEMS